jgi:hypothetical protein
MLHKVNQPLPDDPITGLLECFIHAGMQSVNR